MPNQRGSAENGSSFQYTVTGQCQRYHEYESRPRKRATVLSSTYATGPAPAPPRGRGAAVPITGIAVAHPGWPVPSSTRRNDATINPNETALVAAIQCSLFRSATVEIASSAPAPNSQARVGSV